MSNILGKEMANVVCLVDIYPADDIKHKDMKAHTVRRKDNVLMLYKIASVIG